jgi:hypothetical protein
VDAWLIACAFVPVRRKGAVRWQIRSLAGTLPGSLLAVRGEQTLVRPHISIITISSIGIRFGSSHRLQFRTELPATATTSMTQPMPSAFAITTVMTMIWRLFRGFNQGFITMPTVWLGLDEPSFAWDDLG